MNDLPNLYDTEKHSARTWCILYDGDPFAYVVARDGQPDEDAKYRAKVFARVMNATRDMKANDIRRLLQAYEKQNGRRFHADWRGDDQE